jgi:predicted negative regulator of RcsB-dependent stress response
MATLDLQEQEQLDALKALWKRYGNLVTWTVIVVIVALGAWNGWRWWQREQALNAGAMYDELERAAEAGDAAKTARVFADLSERYPRTVYAAQGGLLDAKTQADKGRAEAARASLTWVALHGGDDALQTIARLRLAASLADGGQYAPALEQLERANAKGFEALVADRRGDVLAAQGKPADARAAYEAAYRSFDEKADYRRVVEAKLMALGVAPPAAKASAASEAAS